MLQQNINVLKYFYNWKLQSDSVGVCLLLLTVCEVVGFTGFVDCHVVCVSVVLTVILGSWCSPPSPDLCTADRSHHTGDTFHVYSGTVLQTESRREQHEHKHALWLPSPSVHSLLFFFVVSFTCVTWVDAVICALFTPIITNKSFVTIHSSDDPAHYPLIPDICCTLTTRPLLFLIVLFLYFMPIQFTDLKTCLTMLNSDALSVS